MRALVAHPSPLVAEGMADLLAEQFAADTSVAVTLAECTLFIAESQPDLVVVDVELAPGHELTLCRRLVADGVKAVMVTHRGTDNHLGLLEQGAAGIAVADDGMPGLLAAVRTVLDGHVHVPAHLLGVVLHDLIVEHRAERVEPAARLENLSPRELDVLGLLGAGADTREIAARLVISPHTAKTHINRILGKLGVGSRTEAAAFAVDHGIRPSVLEASSE